MADFCSNDSQSPQPKVDSGQIIRHNAQAYADLMKPYSIRSHHGAEKLQESFLSAIRKVYQSAWYRNTDSWDVVDVEPDIID
jgi:hypothetical protein